MATDEGLRRKYRVSRVDGRDRPGGDRADASYFVLDFVHDPHARVALRAYIDSCSGEYSRLARDLNLLLSFGRCNCKRAELARGEGDDEA